MSDRRAAKQLDRLFGPQARATEPSRSRAGRGRIMVRSSHQQTLARRPGRPRTLAHRRVAADTMRRTLMEIEPVWRAISRPITSPTRPSQTFPALDQAIHDRPCSRLISTASASPNPLASCQNLCLAVRGCRSPRSATSAERRCAACRRTDRSPSGKEIAAFGDFCSKKKLFKPRLRTCVIRSADVPAS